MKPKIARKAQRLCRLSKRQRAFLFTSYLSTSLFACVDSDPPGFYLDYGIIREDVCGDGVLSRNEQCEDGNQIDGDGCSSQCTVEPIPVAGMEASASAGEMAGETAGEMAGEMAGEIAGEIAGEVAGEMAGEIAGEMAGEPSGLLCGDGVIGLGETCDDGNQEDGDGCSAACQTEGPSCLDDISEPNNDFSSATEINATPGQSTQEYMLCVGDRDYYELRGCLRGDLDVIVEFDTNLMDIDVRLTDSTGRLLDSSALAGQVERVSHYYAQDEPVYLEVFGYLDTAEGAYTVTTTLQNCASTPNECSFDGDCIAGQLCDGGQCISVQQCTNDVNCAPNESCVSGECVITVNRCDFNFDCPVGQRCDAGQCVSSTPSDCTFDTDCVGGQRCDLGQCVNPSTLVDDLYEENDDQATATELSTGNYQNLILVSEDEDYFAIEVCAGGTLESSIFFSTLMGDLELKIENSQGMILDSSASWDDSETVSWTNRGGVAETVYVVVYGFLADEGPYNLSLNTTGCGEVPVDPLEEDRFEDNDVFQEATPLTPGVYEDLTRTESDDDWYAVEVCEGGTINVELLFSHQQGDLNAWLYNSAVFYLDGSLSSTDDESLSATVLSTQTVYINVFSFSDEASYQLNISITGCAEDLEPDRLEENDTRETGEVLSPNLYGDLTITEGDEDWILFDVCEGGDITVNVTFDDDLGDLDAALYDESGLSVRTGSSSSDNETLSLTDAPAGRYALRVYGYSNSTNTYDLSFSVNNCDPSGLQPDRLEENDTRETGEVLTPNLYSGLTITSGDEDWILFDVCEGATITVNLTFTDASGDIDAYLYNENDVSVAYGTSSSDNEELTVNNASEGRYALKVYGFLDDENSYDLSFTVTSCAPETEPGELTPDRLEENNSRETAEVLTPNYYSNLNIIGDDEDWIAIDVCEGADLTIDILFTDADGDIDARLTTEADVYIDSAIGSSDNEQLVGTNLAAGRVHLEIYGYGDDNTYDLRITMTCP